MPTSIDALRREPLHVIVQRRLKQFILDNGLRTGDPLPTEAELTSYLGVSRSSVREALRVLETVGVVESRHGQGTFVGRFSLEPFVEGLTFGIQVAEIDDAIRALRELLHVREMLEEDVTRRVTPTISDEVIQELEEIVGRMQANADRGMDIMHDDRAFHRTLFRQLGPSVTVELARAFWYVFANLRNSLPGIAGDISTVVEDHRAILDAVRIRDPEAARLAMHRHFEALRVRLQDSDASSGE
jgi:DNA-binding FadR family transcriptional regulator